MKTIKYLCKRNVKIYFKDKGMFFPSLITPVILLVLYATFLKKVYDDSFRSSLKAAGVTISDSVINGCVGGQLVSSLLAVCCVTVAFCSNLLMVRDKTSGAIKDLTVSPVKPSVLSISYFLSSLLSTLIISAVGAAACLIYLAATGWYLTFADVISLLLNVILLTTFGTALSSCVNFFLSTDGQASAVGTIVSAGYGFICGAYMPLSAFGEGLRNTLGFLPGTYGTSLIRNCTLRGAFEEMSASGFPAEAVESIRDSIDCNLYFFGNKVENWVMYLIMLGSTALLIGLYVLFNVISSRKNAGK
mgnify:FL=1